MQAAHPEVIIIGAGAAGLSAAAVLARHGKSVLMLEARDRIGGRIASITTPGGVGIELGAEFVHGRPPEIFDIISPDVLEEIRGEQWCSRDGKLGECEMFEQTDSVMSQMPRHLKPGEDISFAEFLRRAGESESEAGQWARKYVQGFHAADPERVSVRALLEDERREAEIHGDRVFRFCQSYDELLERLRQSADSGRFHLQYETVVTEVRWDGKSVTVAARGVVRSGADERRTKPREPKDAVTAHSPGHASREYSARAVIVTLPLGVLQSGAVRFVPPLAEKQRALSLLVSGHVVRVTFCLKRIPKFARSRVAAKLSFLFSDDANFPTWWQSRRMGSDGKQRILFTGWAPGPEADTLTDMPEEEIFKRAAMSLSRVLGADLAELASVMECAHTHDWQSDPFALGAYSYPAVGGAEAWRELARPLAGKLFFAGEATEGPGYNATVHGALASGVRAARELLG